MLRKRGFDPLAWVVYGGVVITLLSAVLPQFWPRLGVGWIGTGVAVSVLLAFVGELRRYNSSGQATANLAVAVFAIAYVGGLIGFLVQLRMLGGGATNRHVRAGVDDRDCQIERRRAVRRGTLVRKAQTRTQR